MVDVRRVSKRSTDAPRLNEVSTLLGTSGCGKTALLRSSAGVENVTSGDILIGGEQVNDLPSYRRRISSVFQSCALSPYMSVSSAIAYPNGIWSRL
ncbi:spermidine/putrescine ABC transporter ATP-binding subunit [Pseudomonas sp. ATCC 13867]|uniref:ATP-binding cassette domain-containing protein n=1 Tax=Pseudomonas sp. ATCC 13867 TaxID=1294143 RepID=UPI0002C4E254|nr:ATP-binding cassette domain-containing protein [Pseudomonas sp. ATCC 13867]AGI26117.1 spermidine/putrescine ABC transporter ATP-binding subunit [Pseudomonas sp. ATCC 13867]